MFRSFILASFTLSLVESVKLAFLLVASSSTSCSFPVVYCYTAELFPTPVRGAVTGACSTFSRIGAILAPIIESTVFGLADFFFQIFV